MDRFRVMGGARLVGEVSVSGAKNSVLKLMAAALLAEGRTTLTAVPDILDTDYMAALLRRLGCEVEVGAGQVVIDVPAGPGPRGGLRPGAAPARVHLRARPAGRALRRGQGRAAGRRQHRLASAGLSPRRAREAGRDERVRARLHHRPGARRAARGVDLAGLPERRGDREHPDGRGARGRDDGDRQRGARARDRRPRRHADPDGREDQRRRARRRSRSRASAA